MQYDEFKTLQRLGRSMIREAIEMLVSQQALTEEVARQVALEILDGSASPAQIGSFVTALRIRGESAEHIRAFAEVMREKAARLTPPSGVVLDTCGTGGDCRGTFNISTTAAFIAAGAGVCVAKHGNRGASSRCGSADVLEALGVRLDLSASQAEECLRTVGMCFMFAPSHHSAMRHVAAPRKEIGIRTIFNLLGPLSNPAGATHQIVGVFDRELTETYAEALAGLGSQRALVVHGEDGLDEITTTSATRITELADGSIATRSFVPEDFGLDRSPLEALIGGDAQDNAKILRAILEGGATQQQTDVALLNAGAALYLAGLCGSIREGVVLARKTLESGEPLKKLEALKALTHEVAQRVG